MPIRQLSTAIIGLDDRGLGLLETASRLEDLRIDAVADKDTLLSAKIASQYNCKGYDDYRQLIIQNTFDCLLVCEPLYNCHQHIHLAVAKKFNILKLFPPARYFAETAELTRAVTENNIIFSVASPWRFSRSYLALFDFVANNPEKPLMLTATCSYSRENLPAWYNDPQLAGGGVLLRNSYGLIDQLVKIFGLPEQIYSITTNTASDKQQKLALTEDIASVLMRFADNFCVNLVTSRNRGPESDSETMKIHYKDFLACVSETSFKITHLAENTSEEKKLFYDADSLLFESLSIFAASCLDKETNKPSSTLSEHLSTMAVIEAAYLSAKTRMPEEPARILSLAR